MVNLRIFVAWDLTFGSGMQALGSLLAVLAAGWWLDRTALLRELGGDAPPRPAILLLYAWIRYVVPLLVGGVGLWWLLSEALAA
jgi:SNF family Na+-dependent transporter